MIFNPSTIIIIASGLFFMLLGFLWANHVRHSNFEPQGSVAANLIRLFLVISFPTLTLALAIWINFPNWGGYCIGGWIFVVCISSYLFLRKTNSRITEKNNHLMSTYDGSGTSHLGLYKFGTRYYDPKLGRWTQQDPVGGSLGSSNSGNHYVYANDNPVMLTDPSGNDPSACTSQIFQAFAGFVEQEGPIAALAAVATKLALGFKVLSLLSALATGGAVLLITIAIIAGVVLFLHAYNLAAQQCGWSKAWNF